MTSRNGGVGSLSSVLLDDFSSSILSQLPPDLQKILRVTTEGQQMQSYLACGENPLSYELFVLGGLFVGPRRFCVVGSHGFSLLTDCNR